MLIRKYIAAASLAVLTTTLVVSTESQAQAAEQSESKKDIDPKSKLLWLDAEGGISHANLSTFSADFNQFSAGFLPRTGTGPMAGAAIGVRFVFLTLGVRGRVASYENSDRNQAVSSWNMSSLNGEIGLRVPLHRLEPYATLSGGYTTFGGFGNAVRGVQDGVNVNGFNTRLGIGLDYFLSRYISLGAQGTGEVLALTRPGVPVREVAQLPQSDTVEEGAVRFLQANGSTYGLALSMTAGVKAHF